MQASAQVTILGDELAIERLRVRNPNLCRYIESFPSGEHEARIVDALTIGAEVLQKARAKSETDYIDRRFAEVSQDFSERLNEVVNGTTRGINELVTGTKSQLAILLNPRDGTSPLKERFEAVDDLMETIKQHLLGEYEKIQSATATLSAQFDPVGLEDTSHMVKLKNHIAAFEGRVKTLFDPKHDDSYFKMLTEHLEGVFDPKAGSLPALLDKRLTFTDAASPFGMFRKEVENKLNDMREKVVESIGDLRTEIEAYRAQVGQSAADREKMSAKGDDFEEAALELLSPFAEKRGDTVERVGTEAGSGSNKKGDLNYRFHGNEGLVAIEAKNQKVASVPKFTDGLLSAVRNRHAGFGILVVRDVDQLPKGLGEWHFDISTDGIGYIFTHSGLLELSLKFAHARLRYASAEVAGVDVSALKVLIDAVTKKLKDAGSIKSNLTAIESTVETIRQQLEGMIGEIKMHMDTIDAEIAKARSDA